MSAYPNTLLLLYLFPKNNTKKTYCAICENSGLTGTKGIYVKDIEIENRYYAHMILLEYDGHFQIPIPEPGIVLFDFVASGYGESVKWEDLEKQKNGLEQWAKNVCSQFNCLHEIHILANFY